MNEMVRLPKLVIKFHNFILSCDQCCVIFTRAAALKSCFEKLKCFIVSVCHSQFQIVDPNVYKKLSTHNLEAKS